MFLWFVGTAVVTVRFVFQDPRFDYRLLVVGAVVPLFDGVFGGARVLHTLAFSLALLALVMVATIGHRPARRILLGLPIGTMLHLVFDGAWTDTALFWWPLGGVDLDSALPEVERGWWDVPMEIVGLVLVVWIWRSSGLGRADGRRRFLRTGQLFVSSPSAVGHSRPC